ncbi:uncharacterized protein LOC134475817 [Cavia porcellus]|uniref:uncharacterized protein LOC134475817 n=1 Tax=Cavia porcellus TaxID=10141 RepID=UPI002FE404FC
MRWWDASAHCHTGLGQGRGNAWFTFRGTLWCRGQKTEKPPRVPRRSLVFNINNSNIKHVSVCVCVCVPSRGCAVSPFFAYTFMPPLVYFLELQRAQRGGREAVSRLWAAPVSASSQHVLSAGLRSSPSPAAGPLTSSGGYVCPSVVENQIPCDQDARPGTSAGVREPGRLLQEAAQVGWWLDRVPPRPEASYIALHGSLVVSPLPLVSWALCEPSFCGTQMSAEKLLPGAAWSFPPTATGEETGGFPSAFLSTWPCLAGLGEAVGSPGMRGWGASNCGGARLSLLQSVQGSRAMALARPGDTVIFLQTKGRCGGGLWGSGSHESDFFLLQGL